jgi:hypothetical protein
MTGLRQDYGDRSGNLSGKRPENASLSCHCARSSDWRAGPTRLTEQTEARLKEHSCVEQVTEVQVRPENNDASARS